MRSILGATLVIGACVVWTGACASLSGLSQYSAVSGDGSVGSEAGSLPGDDSSIADPDSTTDDVVVPGEDGGGSSSGGETDSAPPYMDAGNPTDAGHTGADASHACSKSNCSTCCTDAGCASANANVACGPSCIDCTAMGKACNNGSCVSTSCNAQSCGSCTPYFVPCCKGTGGCGCSLLFPPGPCT